MALLRLLSIFVLALDVSYSQPQMRTNPALPGWHSDPSCVFISKKQNIIFCTSSTFLLTPGLSSTPAGIPRTGSLPVTPCPEGANTRSSIICAPTIRYRNGNFYIITVYKNNVLGENTGLIFNTTDPYRDDTWSNPTRYNATSIDPDLFWDDEGMAYVATAGTYLQTADVRTGKLGEQRQIWNGTRGSAFLEGPHLYRKDGYYYLLTAEGGSGLITR